MTIIRVDPALLKDFASTMQGVGGEVAPLGSSVTAASQNWFVVAIEPTR